MELCPAHERLEGNIDRILELQLEQIERTTRLEDTIDNGLKSTVTGIKDKVTAIEARVSPLEAFSWFGEWVNKARNNLFFTVIKVGFGLLIILFIYRFGNDAIIKLLRG